jgi:hypothetical protein
VIALRITGSSTVRALAAMIDHCGILRGADYRSRRELRAAVSACYRQYVRGTTRSGRAHGESRERGAEDRCPIPANERGRRDDADSDRRR